MKADEYTLLAQRMDQALETEPWPAVEPMMLGLGVKPVTVANRLQEIWGVPRFELPPLMPKTARGRASLPDQLAVILRHRLELRGPTVAAQRPRVFGRGMVGVNIHELLFRRALQIRAWHQGMKPIPCDGWGVRISIAAHRPNPLTVPDVDNIAKTVLDAFTSDGYFRDQRVTGLSVYKLPGPVEKTVVEVSW
jgi:Holliday junction resolvase RusA-like endonuclease